MSRITVKLSYCDVEATNLKDPNDYQHNQPILLNAKIPTDEDNPEPLHNENPDDPHEEDDDLHYLRCRGCGELRPITEFQSCNICGLSYCSLCFDTHDCKSLSIHGHPLAHHTAMDQACLPLKQVYIVTETGRLQYILPVDNPQCRILITQKRLMDIAFAPHLATPEEHILIKTHYELRMKLRQIRPGIKFN